MRRTLHNADGFTVIEVLVAVALMAIALSGIASMNVSTISADTQSRGVSAATALAQAKLEQLRVLSRAHANWAAGSHSEAGLRENGTSGGPYTRAWVVQHNYSGFNNLSRVTVTVSWYGGQVSLASLYW